MEEVAVIVEARMMCSGRPVPMPTLSPLLKQRVCE
jgi:hypothetical protein